MSLKQAVFHAFNRNPTHFLLGAIISAISTTKGNRAWITYDKESNGWLKRTAGGTALVPDPRGMGIEEFMEFSKDYFMYDYAISPGDIVLDIGAGVGESTIPFAEMVGPGGRVVAVEAHPGTFSMLKRTCLMNGLSNVELVHAAVMDSEAPVMISNLQADSSYVANRIGSEGIRVPAVTLTTLVTTFELDRIDFLKMNIEGAEVPALRGAREILPMVRHAAIGCHDFLAKQTGDDSYRTKEAVMQILTEAGFKVRSRDQDPRPWAADYLYASR